MQRSSAVAAQLKLLDEVKSTKMAVDLKKNSDAKNARKKNKMLDFDEILQATEVVAPAIMRPTIRSTEESPASGGTALGPWGITLTAIKKFMSDNGNFLVH